MLRVRPAFLVVVVAFMTGVELTIRIGRKQAPSPSEAADLSRRVENQILSDARLDFLQSIYIPRLGNLAFSTPSWPCNV
jgi:hypothetical protein